MTVITRDTLRKEASDLLAQKGKGTIVADMGSGKSWIALDSMLKVSSNFPADYVIKVLITSPRTNLKDNWRTELKKFGLKQKNDETWLGKTESGELVEYDIILENVQTAYKWAKSEWIKFDIIIADEIHTMVTEEYSQVFDIPHTYLFGFTGTADDIKDEKAVLYEEVAPILLRYEQAATDGLINKRRYILFRKRLLSSHKLSITIRKKIHLMGEFEANRYFNNLVSARDRILKQMFRSSNSAWSIANRTIGNPGSTPRQKMFAFAYKKAIRERAELLYNLPSNVALVNILINKIQEVDSEGKVLVFSKRNDQVVKICGDNVVYQKNTADENTEVLRRFNDDEIKVIGSCESLTLGLNLTRPKYAIVESFTGSATETLQKLGRTNRLDKDDFAINTFIVPKDTQATKWFESFMYEAGLSYSDFEIVDNSNEFKETIEK